MYTNAVFVDWTEFLVAFILILIPIMLALHVGKNGAKTVSDYFFGNKKMPFWAIVLSHSAAALSPIGMIGHPAEIYAYGTQNSLSILSAWAMGLTQSYIFLPVLYNLQLDSIFEYCELRFSKDVRTAVSAINAIYELTLTACMAYLVSIVISQFAGTNQVFTTTILMATCVTYTTAGGFKGVIYGDAFQCIIILGTFLIIFILCCINVGGWHAFYNQMSQSNHFEFFELGFNQKQSLWSATFGYYLTRTLQMAGSASYQRAISLPTIEQAQKANLVYSILITSMVYSITMPVGLMLLAIYKGCDPVSAKILQKFDQLVPYFILTNGAKYKGIVGIFLAGVSSSSLSTMATLLNNSSGVIYRDFIQQYFKEHTDEGSTRAIKVLCVVLGVICWVIALTIERAGSAFQIFLAFGGLSSGSIFAVFTLGMFVPRVRAKSIRGAIYPWLGITFWLSIAQVVVHKPSYPTKIMTVNECPSNITFFRNTSIPIDPIEWNKLNPFYRISSSYNGLIAFGFVFSLSIIYSYLLKDNQVPEQRLLSHLIRSKASEPTNNQNEVPLLLTNNK